MEKCPVSTSNHHAGKKPLCRPWNLVKTPSATWWQHAQVPWGPRAAAAPPNRQVMFLPESEANPQPLFSPSFPAFLMELQVMALAWLLLGAAEGSGTVPPGCLCPRIW